MVNAFNQLLPYVSADIATVAFSLTLQNLCILADSALHAKREYQFEACHESPEHFDACDDTQCDSSIQHLVAAAQANATVKHIYSCSVANSFEALECDDDDDTSVDEHSLNDSNSQELANTHMSGIDCSAANPFEALDCDDCGDASEDDHSLK
eukprot:12419896-Karenia_brevis.AAC.1